MYEEDSACHELTTVKNYCDRFEYPADEAKYQEIEEGSVGVKFRGFCFEISAHD